MSCSEDVLIKQYFEIFDNNGDGMISKTELKKILQVLYKSDLNDADIQKQLEHYDTDESGTLEIEEFKKLYRSLPLKPRGDSLWAMFDFYDHDHDKSLSKDEVRQFLKDIDPEIDVTEEMVDKLMKETDLNNSGTVDFGEFCRMYVLMESKKSLEKK